MSKMELFFDYACPYCMRAHSYLKELAPRFPDVQISWNPCEAHPRPDRYGPHSDLLIRGMFFARDRGADLWAYHDMAYQAALGDRVDVEDASAVAGYISSLLDAGELLRALEQGAYRKELDTANDYAYGRSGVWVVPAYRMDGRKIDPVEDVGVTAGQLERFMRGKA